MNVSDGLEFFALADRLKFSEHKGKACSANKCRIRESDLRSFVEEIGLAVGVPLSAKRPSER
jgi:hypothetical protein